jgi:hypothetical protein
MDPYWNSKLLQNCESVAKLLSVNWTLTVTL